MHLSIPFKMSDAGSIQGAEGTTSAQAILDAGATPATDEQVRAFEALVEAIHAEGEAVGDLRLSIAADGTALAEEAGGALHAAPASIQMLLARAAELIAGKEGQPGAVKRAEVAASLLPFASAGTTGLDTQAPKGLAMLAEDAEGIVGMERVVAALSGGNRHGSETRLELLLRPESAGTAAAAGALQPATGPLSTLGAEGGVVPGRANFNGALAQQVRWLVDQGTEMAELRLDPPRLGSLGVRVRLEGDQAVLNFQSAHAPVREAVEAAVPRLRELLSEAGIDLVDVQVGTDDGAHQWGRDADTGEGAGAGGGAGSTSEQDSGNEVANSGIEVDPTIGIFDGYA